MSGESEDFWHGPAPAARLGLYRLLFGLLIFAEVLTWLPDTRELFSNAAFHVPAGRWAPSPGAALALCLCLATSSLFLAIGLRTKTFLFCTLLFWHALVSIDTTNERAIHSVAQVIMAILLFSRCDQAYSLDAWLGPEREFPLPAPSCSFPLRLLQLEVAQIYFFSGVNKAATGGWLDGSTLAAILNSRWSTNAGLALQAALPDWAFPALGTSTLAFELLAPFLLFTRARPWAVAAALSFHLGIQLCLYVGSLGLHFILAVCVLFTDWSRPSLTKPELTVIK